MLSLTSCLAAILANSWSGSGMTPVSVRRTLTSRTNLVTCLTMNRAPPTIDYRWNELVWRNDIGGRRFRPFRLSGADRRLHQIQLKDHVAMATKAELEAELARLRTLNESLSSKASKIPKARTLPTPSLRPIWQRVSSECSMNMVSTEPVSRGWAAN